MATTGFPGAFDNPAFLATVLVLVAATALCAWERSSVLVRALRHAPGSGERHRVGLLGSALFHWSLVGLFVFAAFGQLARYEGTVRPALGCPFKEKRASYMIGFLGVSAYHRGLRVAGVAVLPVVLRVMGGSLLVGQRAQAPISSLASAWLVVRVLFANLAFGAYAVSFAIAVTVLLSESRWRERLTPLLERSSHDVDELMY